MMTFKFSCDDYDHMMILQLEVKLPDPYIFDIFLIRKTISMHMYSNCGAEISLVGWFDGEIVGGAVANSS